MTNPANSLVSTIN